jgi:type I restriction enzyme M protein
MSKNERKTENVVRDALRKCGFYDPASDIQVEEQKSNIEAVKRLMKATSKSGGGGGGSPEFIVSAPSAADFLLVVECKADTRDHGSAMVANLLDGQSFTEDEGSKAKRTQRFAIDGALHYAKSLSREFNVIAVGVSGETKRSSHISTYLWPKSSNRPKELRAKDGAALGDIIPLCDYIEHATFDPTVQKLRFDELMSFAADLHEFMRD